MKENEFVSVNSLSNIIEIGKRVILQSGSDAYTIPECENVSERVSEDLGAAIANAIATAKITKEV